MTNLAMYSLVVGFFAPLVIGFLKRSKWSESVKSLFAFLVCLVLGALLVFFQQPDWNWRDWIASALLVLVTAITTYQHLWKPTGIEPKVSDLTG